MLWDSLRLILHDQLLKLDDNAMIGRRCDDRVAVNIGWVLVRKAWTGQTDFGAVTCQVDGSVTIH